MFFRNDWHFCVQVLMIDRLCHFFCIQMDASGRDENPECHAFFGIASRYLAVMKLYKELCEVKTYS